MDEPRGKDMRQEKKGRRMKEEMRKGKQGEREREGSITCLLTFKKHYFKLLREAAEGGPDTIYAGKMWQN